MGDSTDIKRDIKGQGFFYLLIGTLSALIDFSVFQLLYSVFGIDVAFSNPVALIVSTVFHFSANRTVTFQSTSNPLRSIVLYTILLAFNMAVSTVMITVLIGLGIHSALAKVAMQVCVAGWNFFIYRRFIFI